MAKCYLMIEDAPGGITFAADFGNGEEDLPESVADLTEAQYTVHEFLTVLRGVMSPEDKLRAEVEVRSKIVAPY